MIVPDSRKYIKREFILIVNISQASVQRSLTIGSRLSFSWIFPGALFAFNLSELMCCFNVNVNKMNTHCSTKNRPRNLMAVLKKNLLLSISFVSVCVYGKICYIYSITIGIQIHVLHISIYERISLISNQLSQEN